MQKYFDLPPVWTVQFALIAYLLADFLPIATFSGAVFTLLAWLSSWAGFALILFSAMWFFREKTPIEPRHKPKSLLVRGPYKINRNPIYTGLVLILAGFCLWLGALSSLICVPALVWVLTKRFIEGEEAALLDAFGSEAEAYMAKTRRW
jgi:protein-S-isoprenylcysteine O-methyltransferase Ste14